MLFRKKPKEPVPVDGVGAEGAEHSLEQVKTERRNIVAVVRDNWVRFQPGRVAGKGAALAGRFDQFVGPVSEDVCRRFPFVHWVP